MRPLPRLFLVALLCFAQIWAGVHAVEHAVAGKEGVPAHVCEICLAAHDLGSALPSLVALPVAAAAHDRPLCLALLGRSAFPAPLARQGAPPLR